MKKIRKIFMISFCTLVLMGTGLAEEGLKYNKDGYPVFEFLDAPLIYSMKGSYQINDTILSGNISNHHDSNINLKYILFARKYILNPPTVTIGPAEQYNKSTGQWEVIDKTETQKNIETTDIPSKKESSSLSGINYYLNKPSTLTEFPVEYEIFKNDVKYFTPFIFELGNWPKYIGGKNIDDSLDGTIYEDDLIIYGTEKVLIFVKDSESFYYKVNKNNGYYYLSIQTKIEDKQKGKLKIIFRPLRIRAEIKNIDTLPLTNIYSSLKIKPELNFEISSKDIDQLNFTYKSDSNTITKNKKLESDGKIRFDEPVLTEGNKIWYPLDSYNAEITVEPPLLINEEKNLDMIIESDFEGNLQINNNKIDISIQRSVMAKLKYFLPLISLILLFGIAIISKQPVFAFVGLFIGQFSLWYFIKNPGYFNSFGSLVSIITLIISLWIFINRNVLIK
ncbi:MAG: hypothetical protein MUP85_20275 [Candidatus Lokiarchaeota archaeon]|nr:hypothetical protein [Candidatus Lokiarchaeota archaeon]